MFKMGAPVQGTRSPTGLNVVWWHLVIFGPQDETHFMLLVFCLEFWGGY